MCCPLTSANGIAAPPDDGRRSWHKCAAPRPGGSDTVAMDDAVERVRAHFDAIGDAEWDRLAATPRDRVSFELHRRMLAEFVRPGDRVLEIGAGPGRFTIELARLGARVTVTDISPVQLALNERHVREAGCEESVERASELDVRDVVRPRCRTSSTRSSRTAARCRTCSRTPDIAFHQLVHVTRPEGVVLASVMSTVGSFRYFLPLALEEARAVRRRGVRPRHGDRRPARHPGVAHVPDVPMARDRRRSSRARRADRRGVGEQLHVARRRRGARRGSRPTPSVGRGSSSGRRGCAGSRARSTAARTSCSRSGDRRSRIG